MKHVAVLLADGFEEVEAITQVDFLRRAELDVAVLGVTGQSVTGGHGIVVHADRLLSDYAEVPDAVVIPGGTRGAENIAHSSDALSLVSRCLEDGKLVAAICAAPGVVLGAHGMLAGHSFTCYPGFQDRVDAGTFREDRVVVDGNLITSRGPGTSAEFALAIIRYLVDRETAAELAAQTLQPV
jgi:4-methyl-5(b-hydroxyethyl)-thiazole monophosphate biosynthesis